jgi:aspartyl-tRNA(Asn)/glutamyl-tRNA(Gln) amidotransferase subunit A
MGLVGFAPSLDTIGIMSRTVDDCSTVLRATAKRDALDSTSAQFPTESLDGTLPRDLRGKRIALVREVMELDISEGQRIAHSRAADVLRELGAEVSEVSIPSLPASYAVYYAISSAEASSNLARFDGVRYGMRAEGAESLEELYVKSRSLGFGEEVKRRMTFGALILGGDYKKDIYENALRMRARINSELADAFSKVDLLMLPTSSGYAYRAGDLKDGLFDAHAKDDLLCTLSSLSGLPSISLPCSTVRKLPLGIQLVGRAFEEKTLFDVAAHLQCALN